MFFVQKNMVNCKAHTVSNSNDGAFAALRVQAPCMEMGQAAGIAASICLERDCAVHGFDTDLLVEKVRREGSFV